MTDRAIPVCVLEILKEYSDAEHILTVFDINAKMAELYGITIDRRAVYNAVDMLTEVGYEISDYTENRKGYYLKNRLFDASEIKLLMDAVYSFKYISQKQTEELTGKLQKLLCENRRKTYNHLTSVKSDRKSQNNQIFVNVEILNEAINKKHKVAFIYQEYDMHKKLVPRSEEKVVVSPYGMVCDHSFYYLVNIRYGYTEPSMYRIDYMKDIEILEEAIEISAKDAKLNTLDKVTYAFLNEPVHVKLKGTKSALRHVIDEFGTRIKITKSFKNGSFIAEFNSTQKGIAVWALQFIDLIEILEPQSVRDEIKEKLKGKYL